MAIPDKAITRNEQYLSAMAGQSGRLPDAPITRKERYLAKAAGQAVETPPPITREEMYLDVIAEGGGGGGEGMTPAVKSALLQLMEHVAYTDEHGQEYYDALVAALNGGSTPDLESISAVFNQGSAFIYDTDNLDTLKQYLTVTANYSDGTTETVNNYALSGTLSEGTSPITVSYGGKTTTFNVTVSEDVSIPLTSNTDIESDWLANKYELVIRSGVTPCILIPQYNSTNKTCLISGCKITKLSLYCAKTGMVTIGKANLLTNGEAEPTMIGGVQHEITVAGGYNDFECDISLGEHEAICLLVTGDTSNTVYYNYHSDISAENHNKMKIFAADNAKRNNGANMSLLGAIYGYRNNA